MMWRRGLQSVLVSVFFAAAAAAQQRPIFDPDDFVDPAQRRGRPFFVTRLVLGGVASFVDDYRPLRQNVAFVHVANSFYWRRVELAYKHSEIRGEDNGPVRVQRCDCPDPIYFPTPAPADATPAAPLPSPKDTLQIAWYGSAGAEGTIPIVRRYRLSWSRQPVDTLVTSGQTGKVSRLDGREQSFGLDADTHLSIGGHAISGSLRYARTQRSGTTDNRAQNELVYVNHFPGRALGPIIVRATLGFGSVSNRAGTALNVVTPTFEAFHHIGGWTQANVHLVWSPVRARSGAGGWKTTHQIALFVDRALIVKLLPASK